MLLVYGLVMTTSMLCLIRFKQKKKKCPDKSQRWAFNWSTYFKFSNRQVWKIWVVTNKKNNLDIYVNIYNIYEKLIKLNFGIIDIIKEVCLNVSHAFSQFKLNKKNLSHYRADF